jgi:uncharacterized membrane protein
MSERDPNSGIVLTPKETGAVAARPGPVQAGFVARLRNYFLTGLVLVGPIYITINLTWWFINWVDAQVRPLIPAPYRPETYLPFYLPGMGLIIALLALTVLGFLAANLVGRSLLDFGEAILHRVPVVRPIYKSLKQIFETVFSDTGSGFRRVGLVEFPGPGMWSLVFLAPAPGPNVASRLPEGEHIAAFMPCTPNPTTGFFFYVRRRDVIDLDITVETAMTLLMSAGLAQSGDDAQKRLAALAEVARARTTATAQAPRTVEPVK